MNNAVATPGPEQHIEHLLKIIDSLIFLELAIAYYCDNLTLLLVFRLLSQIFYVQQHKVGSVTTRTQILPPIVANVICLLTHLIRASPEAAARSARGYLHGGLILDLIGEKGPISEWRLIGQDLLIFGLQCLMLAIGHERNVLAGETKEVKPAQNLDAEEAGLRASQEESRSDTGRAPDVHESEEGMEMQSFLPPAERASSSTPAADSEDLVLTLNIISSLRGLLQHNRQPRAEGEEVESAIERAADNADRLRQLIQQLSANRMG